MNIIELAKQAGAYHYAKHVDRFQDFDTYEFTETALQTFADLIRAEDVKKLAIAIEALEYWKNECSGYEPSISVFNLKVDDALNKIRSE